MAGQLILSEVADQSAPASGKTNLWASNDATPVPKWIDDGGNISVIMGNYLSSITANFAGGNVNTAQPWLNTTEDTITLPGSSSFDMEGVLLMSRAAGTTSHTLGILFGGTATFTSLGYFAQAAVTGGGNVLTALSGIRGDVATSVVVTAANAIATAHYMVWIRGQMRINAGGTVIPQFIFSAAPGGAPTILPNTFFRLSPWAGNAIAARGPWT